MTASDRSRAVPSRGASVGAFGDSGEGRDDHEVGPTIGSTAGTSMLPQDSIGIHFS